MGRTDLDKPSTTSARERLAPEERRRRLVAVAARLLTEDGVDRVQFTEVAAAAGVTRPVVYRFFENRTALLEAVLDEWEATLTRRFGEASATALGGDPKQIAAFARAFVEAVCDTIDEVGAGAWHLLDAKGPDAAVADYAAQMKQRLIAPWFVPIAAVTHAAEREVATVCQMLVASTRATLDLWLDGTLDRDETIEFAARATAALLAAFTEVD